MNKNEMRTAIELCNKLLDMFENDTRFADQIGLVRTVRHGISMELRKEELEALGKWVKE